jgi:hypothetical protein
LFRLLPPKELACRVLFGLVSLTWSSSPSAACSRPIKAFFTSQLAAIYSAQPDRGLPSLVDGLSQQSGCPLRIFVWPPARGMEALADGQGDMLIGATYNSGMEAVDSFVPLLNSQWLLVALPDSRNLPARLDDFANDRHLLIGDVRGVPYPADVSAALDRLRQQQQLDEAVNIEMALSKLLAHRDAAVIITASAYIVQLDRIRSANLRLLPQAQFAPAVTGIYLSRKSLADADRATLTAAINAVVAQGLPIKLLQTHIPNDLAPMLQSPTPPSAPPPGSH